MKISTLLTLTMITIMNTVYFFNGLSSKLVFLTLEKDVLI